MQDIDIQKLFQKQEISIAGLVLRITALERLILQKGLATEEELGAIALGVSKEMIDALQQELEKAKKASEGSADQVITNE